MTDYSKGKIYKLVCHETGEVYFGSTVQTLNKRLWVHKNKRNCKSREIIDRDNYTIELIKDFPCETRKELDREEGIYIRNNICINKRVAGRTYEEFKQDNPETVKMWRKKDYKKYYENNKEKIAERHKEKVTCDCGCVVSRACLTRHKKSQIHLEYLQNIN